MIDKSKLSNYQLGLIAECYFRVPKSILFFNGVSYNLYHTRLGKKITICNLQIQNLIDNGVLLRNSVGGVYFSHECDSLWDDVIGSHKMISPKDPNKTIDVGFFKFEVN